MAVLMLRRINEPENLIALRAMSLLPLSSRSCPSLPTCHLSHHLPSSFPFFSPLLDYLYTSVSFLRLERRSKNYGRIPSSAAPAYEPRVRLCGTASLCSHQLCMSYSNPTLSYNESSDCRPQRIAHEKVEEQRVQLQQQEKQVAELRARIATLEGREEKSSANASRNNQGGTSVDDWSIKVRAFLASIVCIT